MACEMSGSLIFGQEGCDGDEGLLPVWCVQGDGEAPLKESHQPALGGDGEGCLCLLSPNSLGLHNSIAVCWWFTEDSSKQGDEDGGDGW